MAYSDKDTPVNIENKDKHRNSADLLPLYFRTEANKKFLGATIDGLISKGNLDRLNGYVGSRFTTNAKATDVYVTEPTSNRRRYNLLPSAVVRDEFNDKTEWVSTYDDLLNQLNFFNGNTERQDRLTSSDYYVWNPLINYDKFVNYRQYYWLPNGPSPVTITGFAKGSQSTFEVKNKNQDAYIFTPDGYAENPILRVYRGTTYTFSIDSQGHPFYIKTAKTVGTGDQYNTGVTGNGSEQGMLIWTVPDSAPDFLYYQCGVHSKMNGIIEILNADEELAINVESEITGKKDYTSANGVKFTNGLKINFEGSVTPTSYLDRNFYVTGVGKSIKLIAEDELDTPELYSSNFDYEFDIEDFDDTPFDDVESYPTKPEYITIDISSQDKNPWSRYNRWFHKEVIEAAARYNNTSIILDEDQRAKRPIIEFKPNVKLHNFGVKGVANVDLVDTQTTDAMSNVEGSIGYYADQEILQQDMRVIFNADTDITVKGKIYKVNFVKHEGKSRIHLVEDTVPSEGDSVVATAGVNNQGTSWYFDGSSWQKGQQKTSLNQQPKFDLFDKDGNSYSSSTYPGSTFMGNELVSYKIGTGSNDVELGFPISYQNVDNVGDITFEFDWDDNTFDYTGTDGFVKTIDTASGYAKVFSDASNYQYQSGWQKSTKKTRQAIIQINDFTEESTIIQLSCIDDSALKYRNFEVTVEFDGKTHKPVSDFDFLEVEGSPFIVLQFKNTIPVGTRTRTKIYTTEKPNNNGFYEAPINLTNNAENNDLTTFTLGSISDHFKTIFENNINITGVAYGSNNARDVNDIHLDGLRYVKHQGSLLNSMFALVDYDSNIIKATRKVANDYNFFKEQLLQKATEIELTGDIKRDLDLVLYAMSQNRDPGKPYYYSDMLGYGKRVTTLEYEVKTITQNIFGITTLFDPKKIQNRAVYVYLNNELLFLGKDYEFDTVDDSVTIKRTLKQGDKIVINDYDTVGGVVPQTPTKLGLYPKYEPMKYDDETYIETQTVIKGHDGSIMLAFNDFRDDILLEFEKRIYNNLKVEYNKKVFNIDEYVPNAFRKTEYTRDEFLNILRQDFGMWTNMFTIDYVTNNFLDETNEFTYNYKSNRDNLKNEFLPGYWKGIYMHYYGTIKPHLAPWEMIGFTEKPSWFDNEYGAAPYTSGNKKLWNDLEKGIIRDTTGLEINSVYARPGLSKMIPVNDYGELLDPIRAGIVGELNQSNFKQEYDFGDNAPSEFSWRNSSWYPYAIQVALMLMKPAEYFGKLFDTGQNEIAPSGNFLYKITGKVLDLTDVRIHESVVNNVKHFGYGYHTFIVEYLKSQSKDSISVYQDKIKRTSMNLVYKVGGYTSKTRLRVLLETNNNSNSQSVFLPNENYEILLRTSNPVTSKKISGIIVEKATDGFKIRGYDRYDPNFIIRKPIHTKQDPVINVGGQSASFVNWNANKFYTAGQIVELTNGGFWRCTVQHTSTTEFDDSKFIRLPGLPTTGGAEVQKAKRYESTNTIIPYGTTYTKVQDVYDLIMGYGEYLKSEGFVFDKYQEVIKEIQDWAFSGKEFLFWSTQGWVEGSVITLAPFADGLKFSFNYAQVDNVLNSFYEYTLLTASGTPLSKDNFTTTRESGVFTLRPIDTNNGLYYAQLNLVQKEHLLIFDDRSVFGDIIYDQEAGYRIQRLKLLGFKTSEWDGDTYSPGFVYDEAQVTDWIQNQDYYLGDVVRNKNLYYSAKKFIPGTVTFDFNDWVYLGTKPVADLLPNLDYKASSFEDFYSLESENFDVQQTQFAQHLVGYQKRSYLDNLIKDEVSQFKFYQGFIKEKGTTNSISKIQRLQLDQVDTSIESNEEWAFKVGSLGSKSTTKEIEFALDEALNVDNPQGFDFVSAVTSGKKSSNVIELLSKDIAVKPNDYNNNPWPTFDMTLPGNTVDKIHRLPVAGYPRLDDVTMTVFNYDELIGNTVVNSLGEGSSVWVARSKNKDWDVYRLVGNRARVIETDDLQTSLASGIITLNTDVPHLLTKGELISIKDFDIDVDGVYEVNSITSPTQFTIATTLEDLDITEDSATGSLLELQSVRLTSVDDINNLKDISSYNVGSSVFADDDSTGNWAVYKKTEAYTRNKYGAPNTVVGQKFATKIVSGDQGRLIIASSIASGDEGTVSVLRRKFNTNITSLSPVQGFALSDNPLDDLVTGTPEFGSSLALSGTDNTMAVGAPRANNPKIAINDDPNNKFFKVSLLNSVVRPSVREGVVKLLEYDTASNLFVTKYILACPDVNNDANFGYSLAVSDNRLVVGAPGVTNSQGKVYIYTKSVQQDGSTVDWQLSSAMPELHLGVDAQDGDRFGETIAATKDMELIAVGVPNAEVSNADGDSTKNEGAVYVYRYADESGIYDLVQKIDLSNTDIATGDRFGASITMSDKGETLIIGAPYSDQNNTNNGALYYFRKTTDESTTDVYEFVQTILSPTTEVGERFGSQVSLNNAGTSFAVTAEGGSNYLETTFDDSGVLEFPTTFDANTTKIQDYQQGSGTVYTYTKLGTKFVFGQKLTSSDVREKDGFGTGLNFAVNSVLVGAPGAITTDENIQTGSLYVYQKQATAGWDKTRYEPELTDPYRVKNVFTYNTETSQVKDYLEVIDPVKGKIPYLAEKELAYKTDHDPAIYSASDLSVNVNANKPWTDEHEGELWWDLSTIKYLWYEQGDTEYRTNNWGSFFPGSSIDVYEWIATDLTPTEWLDVADTNEGIASGFSGTPKYDNNTYAVKRVYNATTNTFQTRYYYWVRNTVIVPEKDFRTLPAVEVASIIANPVAYGIKSLQLLGKNRISLSNVKTTLSDTDISLAVYYSTVATDLPEHNEWLILQENQTQKIDHKLLIKKLYDSLVGFDDQGNAVPDPDLPKQRKYGIQIRPRQSMFQDRLNALKVVLTYVNDVLAKNRISDTRDISGLSRNDPQPNTRSGKYDVKVDNFSDIANLGTQDLITATLGVELKNGRIEKVSIVKPGFGYKYAPEVTVLGDGSGAVVKTTIDSNGKVTGTEIVKKGQNYNKCELVVRPFKVLVDIDETAKNYWTMYEWNETTSLWIRTNTQTYDLSRFWSYKDYISQGFDIDTTIDWKISAPYQLDTITDEVGDYIEVDNAGDGNKMILQKVESNGTYNSNYDLKFKQRGTIQFNDNLYDYTLLNFGFAGTENFDINLFDEQPATETRIILDVIRNYIFVDDLREHWNKLFFVAVKYALSENVFSDWVFKTSFLNVVNNQGGFSKKLNYNITNPAFIEDYIKEVKPYRTSVREFVTRYNSTETNNIGTTDFDLPSYYNESTGKFEVLNIDSEQITQSPYNNWFDNYTYSVGSFVISDPGEGYTQNPLIVITGGRESKTPIVQTKPYITLVDKDYDGTHFYIKTTSLPNHSFPTQVNRPVAQDFVFKIPRFPQKALTAVSTPMGPIGVATNGVVFFNPKSAETELRNGTVYTINAPDDDAVHLGLRDGGHIDPDGTYHYHSDPVKLYTKDKTVHSPLLGYAFDGYPVYGPYGYSNPNGPSDPKVITSSYRLKTQPRADGSIPNGRYIEDFEFVAGLGDLDQHNGRVCVTPEYPQGTYAYFVTVDPNDTDIPVYPYIIGPQYGGQPVLPNGNFELPSGPTADATAEAFVARGKLREIRLKTEGSGYTSAPILTVIGGGGEAVTKVAKAVPVLKNEKVRINTINMKFDRLNTSNVILSETTTDTYTATEGQVTFKLTYVPTLDKRQFEINIDNETAYIESYDITIKSKTDYTYKAEEGYIIFKTPPGQGANVSIKYKKNIDLMSATDRIEYYYSPTAGMPGKEPAQLMTGVEYPGVQVQGLDFGVSVGWDGLPWFSHGWDTFSGSNTDYAFRADGNTNTFTLPYVPEDQSKVNVYFDGVRQDPTNTPTIIGDGTNATVTLNVTPSSGVLVVFRQEDSDGSLVPTDVNNLDSIISGGTFAYDTATGSKPEDISLDGDGFVTPYTSHAPEEVVPGQVFDTVSMKIYNAPADGSPIIVTKRHFGDGVETTFGFDRLPGTEASIYVTQNAQYLTDSDYTINWKNKTVTLSTTPALSEVVTIQTLNVAGTKILERATFTGDGSTTEFELTAKYEDVKSAFVTVNGIKKDYVLRKANNGSIIVDVSYTTPTDHIIQIVALSTTAKTFSEIKTDEIIHDGSTSEYALSEVPGDIAPLHAMAIVEVNGVRLKAPDTVYYVSNGVTLDYLVSQDPNYPTFTLALGELEVYLNGVKLKAISDYQFDTATNLLTFYDGNLTAGDVIAITILRNHDYEINVHDQADSSRAAYVRLLTSHSDQDKVNVTTFTNHDANLMRKEVFAGNVGGNYTLSRVAVDTNYVWVELDGQPLRGDIDYKVLDDRRSVYIDDRITQATTSRVVITSFSEEISYDAVGYHIFKDMLNRTHFKRISAQDRTKLTSALVKTSTQIEVEDASFLPEPSKDRRVPGVIFVDRERIEYYEKSGNILKQITRGTLGTGLKDNYPIGTLVEDASVNQTVPYSDTVNVYESVIRDGLPHGRQTHVLETLNIVSGVDAHDQVEVYLGGRKLQKPTPTANPIKDHNIEIAFDSYETNSVGTASDVEQVPEFTVEPVSDSTVKGYYKLVLRDVPQDGLELKVVQKQGRVWYEQGVTTASNGVTLQRAETTQAKFLLERTSGLPVINIKEV